MLSTLRAEAKAIEEAERKGTEEQQKAGKEEGGPEGKAAEEDAETDVFEIYKDPLFIRGEVCFP